MQKITFLFSIDLPINFKKLCRILFMYGYVKIQVDDFFIMLFEFQVSYLLKINMIGTTGFVSR